MYIEITENEPLSLIRSINSVSNGNVPDLTKDWTIDTTFNFLLRKHSTQEWVHFLICGEMRGDVYSQIRTHSKGHPRMVTRSHRPDWNGGAERPPASAMREYALLASPLALHFMANQRLCHHAMKETREWMLALKAQLLSPHFGENDEQITLMKATSDYLVPDCIAQGGCPHGKKACGFYKGFVDKYGRTDDIHVRYRLYSAEVL